MPDDGNSKSLKSDAKFDLNSANFDAEAYVRSLLLENGIDDLVAIEEDMVSSLALIKMKMKNIENYCDVCIAYIVISALWI